MSNFLDSVLGEGVGQEIGVGGVFVSSGLIAPWQAARVWTVGAEMSFDDAKARVEADTDLKVGTPSLSARPAGGWTWFTAIDREDIVTIVEALNILGRNDKPQRPGQEWRFEAADADIVSLTKRRVFGDPAVFSCSVGTHGARKGKPYKTQHEFHLIALPAAVNAAALVYGYETPGFDLSELISTDYVPSDENQARLIGAEGHDYKESVLWQQRAALWRALGEENADVYNPIPTNEEGNLVPELAGTKEYKLSTASEKLHKCLRIFFAPWTAPIWCRLQLVTDPRVDAYYEDKQTGDAKRLNVPAITEIFTGEAEARAAAEADSAGTDEGTEAAPTDSKPALPPDWVGFESDWMDVVRGLKEQGKPMPVVLKTVKPEDISATADDVKKWWDHV